MEHQSLQSKSFFMLRVKWLWYCTNIALLTPRSVSSAPFRRQLQLSLHNCIFYSKLCVLHTLNLWSKYLLSKACYSLSARLFFK